MNVIALRNCVRTDGICLCLEIEQVSNNFVEQDLRESIGVKYMDLWTPKSERHKSQLYLKLFSPFTSPASSSRLIKQQSLTATWSPSPSHLYQQHKRHIVSKQKSLSASTSRCLDKQQSLSASSKRQSFVS